MPRRGPSLEVVVVLMMVMVAAACGQDTGSPSSGPSGSSASEPPITDAAQLDGRFAAAVEAAFAQPFTDGSSWQPGPATCNGLGDQGPAGRTCVTEVPGTPPAVTVLAMSVGARGMAGFMFVFARAPDGEEPTELYKPPLGDEATLGRSWADGICRATLAVRDGTLVLSIQVVVPTAESAAACTARVPGADLERVASTLLERLRPFRALGLPRDDQAARERVVELIITGRLPIGERDLVILPPEFAALSDGGEAVARTDGRSWTIVFFEARGVVDHYTGWAYVSDGQLEDDPLGGGGAIIDRLADHWFHVIAS